MPDEPFKKLSLSVKTYAVSIIALGIVALIAALATTDFKSDLFTILAVAVLASLMLELMPIEQILPQVRGEVTLTGSIHLATVALFGYGFATAVGVASCLIAEIARRRSWYKALFNTSIYAIMIMISGLVYLAASRFWPYRSYSLVIPFAMAALVYELVNATVSAGLMTLWIEGRFLRSFISKLGEDSVLFISEALIGLSAVYLYSANLAYSLIVLVPLVALSLAYGKARRYFVDALLAEHELVTAGEVQRHFMPTPLEREDIDVAFRYCPHKNVSGDFFDIFQIGHEIYFAIGDAMGKGIPAALVAASHHQSLRFLATRLNTAEVLEYINRLAYERSLPESFLSMFCARYDIDDRCLYWSNAGHPPPIFYNGRTGGCRLLTNGGIAMGAQANAVYREESLFFYEDDILVMYTDGATESRNFGRLQYGIERLLTVITQKRRLSAEDIADAICESVGLFSGGLRTDDLTTIVLKGEPACHSERGMGERSSTARR